MAQDISKPLVTYIVLHPRRARGAFFDVGANAGLFSALALGGQYAEVLSFEPQPLCADNILLSKLSNGAAAARWRVFNFGLSSGSGNFSVFEESCGMNWHKSNIGRTFQASVVPLSSLMPLVVGGQPIFFKVDVDGSEVSFIEGLNEVALASLPELYVEINSDAWATFGVSLERGVRAFEVLGARYHDIYLLSGRREVCEGYAPAKQFVDGAAPVVRLPAATADPHYSHLKWFRNRLPELSVLRITDWPSLLRTCVLGGQRPTSQPAQGRPVHLRSPPPRLQINVWFAA